ncbi:hypothetical protein M514_25722 [Trichuris suis]|uniref:Uncharacterized protein n=1 Tax=Trichuris suis TaxID=68888 RepID=A0A085MY24_9BILA|nr:hypothetical protein M514_25718 [Trichuris suis]KFD62120.1 hypothetical protein M514_25722 [Trichuris suis]
MKNSNKFISDPWLFEDHLFSQSDRSSTTAADGHEEPGRNNILSILQNSAYAFSLPRNSRTNLDNESLLGTEETLLMRHYVNCKFTAEIPLRGTPRLPLAVNNSWPPSQASGPTLRMAAVDDRQHVKYRLQSEVACSVGHGEIKIEDWDFTVTFSPVACV